jgi:hypothetical protein
MWITLPPLTLSIVFALAFSVAMMVVALTLLFTHDRNHDDIEQSVDFSFSGETMRRALTYYRILGYAMLAAYVLFVFSCLHLQWDGHQVFERDGRPVWAGPIQVMLFALDLVLRGGFFDFMQHFDLRVSHVWMNRKAWGFVWYAFVFRMFFALTLLRMLISFFWIYSKITRVRGATRRLEG